MSEDKSQNTSGKIDLIIIKKIDIERWFIFHLFHVLFQKKRNWEMEYFWKSRVEWMNKPDTINNGLVGL